MADSPTGLYKELARSLDVATFVPDLAEGLVTGRVEDSGAESFYVVKNPGHARYLRLSGDDFFLFRNINGARTVKDLVLLFFKEKKVFAFRRVATLIDELKRRGFLSKQSAALYEQVRRFTIRRGIAGKLHLLSEAMMRREFSIKSIDATVTRIFRWVGIFYSRSALLVYAAVAIIGTVCFATVLNSGRYSILETRDSYALGLAVYLAIDVFVILLHEGSHAFAVKAFGREVVRGGFMIYLGMPAFFVDTSDIWLEGRPKRIAVSAAGPASELVMASVLAMFMLVVPDCPINWLLFRVAFFFYLGVILNMNPLLELDGYYILMDLLGIPNLRKRSLAFVRDKLTTKLARRQAFSREEIIYTVFGVLAGAYTMFVIAVTLYLYKTRLSGALAELAAADSVGYRICRALFLVCVVLPLAAAIGMRLWRLVKSLWRAARNMGLFESSENTSIALLGAVLLLGVFVSNSRLEQMEASTVISAVAALVTFVAVFAVERRPRFLAGMSTRWVLVFLGAMFAADVMARLAARPGLGVSQTTAAVGAFLAGALANLALLVALMTGLNAMRAVRLRAPLALACVITIASFPALWWLLYGKPMMSAVADMGAGEVLSNFTLADVTMWTGELSYVAVPAAIAALCALLLFFWSFASTRMSMAAGLLVIASAMLAVQRLHYATVWFPVQDPVDLTVFCAVHPREGYLLVAGPMALFLVAIVNALHVRSVRLPAKPPDGAFLSDAQRLAFAFDALGEGLLATAEETLGAGVRQALARLAFEASRPDVVQLDVRNQAITLVPSAPVSLAVLREQARRVIEELRTSLEDLIGKVQTRDALSYAFDTLPWDVREIAADAFIEDDDQLKSHHSNRRSYEVTLADNPILCELSESERAELLSALQIINVTRDEVVIREGDRGDAFYIIQEGAVEVFKSDGKTEELLATLHPPEYFGEVALIEDVPRTANCRALAGTTLLVITRKDFQRLVASHFDSIAKVGRAAEVTHLLSRMPLFSEFEPAHMRAVMEAFNACEVVPGEEIITQGDTGDRFYVIIEGSFDVLIDTGADEPAKVAQLRRGEYFGEIALLEDVPRTATVRAADAGVLLELSRNDFEKLLKETILSSETLSRAASRRALDTRRKGVLAGPEDDVSD